ncbi:MAG: hypothetical protein ACKOW8_03705, partial [Flavobacteriales bacterium]
MKFQFYFLLSCVVGMVSCGGSAVTGDSVNTADSVLNVLNQNIIARPDDVMPYLDRARYWIEMGDQRQALEDLNRAVAADSNRTEPYLMRGEF